MNLLSILAAKKKHKHTQELDKRKIVLCAQNGISLVHFRFDETISRDVVEERIKSVLIERNQKKK